MPSPYFDEKAAKRSKSFRYEFAKRPLAGCTVVVAGGTGGLGAATVALLAKEGARLVVGYRANRARAEALQKAIEDRYAQKIKLVEGDVARPEVRAAYLEAIANLSGSKKGSGVLHARVAALLEANHHNIRYLTALRGFTYPMCRYVLFFAEHDPVMYEHDGYFHQMPDQCPWIKEWRPARSG